MDFIEKVKETQEDIKKLQWEGTFTDYLQKVKTNSSIVRLAHCRVYDMIISQGFREVESENQYKFFSGELFGLDNTLRKIVEDYLHSAARRLDVRKRILVLVGPVGGGKSTIVSMLKKGLEKYSKSEAGALYGIKGCPMHEEPLHLIPDDLRDMLHRESGIYIEGNLCPSCKVRVSEKYKGRIEDVLVERVFISEEERRGIGTFSPSDPKSQDISELTGSIDFSTICQYGSESDPRAYRFDGELNKANRGLMEFQEIFKFDEKFLYNLLNLSQEGNFKVGRYALISADEMVIAHSNEAEFKSFINNEKNVALRSRMVIISVPYTLEVNNEVKIYEKIISKSDINVHMAPHALWTIAAFSVLTRLKPSQKQDLTLIKKLKLYNGEKITGFCEKTVKDIKMEFPGEGMEGIDPRFVINVICSVLVKQENKCVSTQLLLKYLKEALNESTIINHEEVKRYCNLLDQLRQEYIDRVTKDFYQACNLTFYNEAQIVFKEYIEMVNGYMNGRDYNEKFMRDLEEQIRISENAKKGFREEIFVRYNGKTTKEIEEELISHSILKEAVDKKVYSDLKELIKINLSSYYHGEEKLQKLIKCLSVSHGYCELCAQELLKDINSLINK